jgi:glutamate N-acetyltransferase/amino-acid N-acetyltransferase
MTIKETKSGLCIEGFRANGIKEGRWGVALIVADKPCETAAVFTTNAIKAAPLILTRDKIRKNKLQAIIANSGNANACVKGGMDDAKQMCEIASKYLGIAPEKIGVSSTGIIGRRIDLASIEKVCEAASKGLSNSPDASRNAAKAIMTTDTKEKMLSYEYKGIQIGGICKGAGMIAPNMATLLCFITTNAALSNPQLQASLRKSVDQTFNMLSVDDDMSTNDSVILLSTGKVKCKREDFDLLLTHLCKELTKLLAADGEGATKIIEVEVSGAKDQKSAKAAVQAIINSNLVKTAVQGENPNWGRIAAAMGRAIKFDFEKINLFFESEKGKATVVERGDMKELGPAHEVLTGKSIKITVALNGGKAKATGWCCDLTKEYIRINAEYN